jgi:hypothetical protein
MDLLSINARITMTYGSFEAHCTHCGSGYATTESERAAIEGLRVHILSTHNTCADCRSLAAVR